MYLQIKGFRYSESRRSRRRPGQHEEPLQQQARAAGLLGSRYQRGARRRRLLHASLPRSGHRRPPLHPGREGHRHPRHRTALRADTGARARRCSPVVSGSTSVGRNRGRSRRPRDGPDRGDAGAARSRPWERHHYAAPRRRRTGGCTRWRGQGQVAGEGQGQVAGEEQGQARQSLDGSAAARQGDSRRQVARPRIRASKVHDFTWTEAASRTPCERPREGQRARSCSCTGGALTSTT
jgi:hypothetical protein